MSKTVQSHRLQEVEITKGSRIERTFECEIKAIDEINHTVEVIVSDQSVDRGEEIILISAWAARLAAYAENPILCWGHPLNQCGPVGPEDCIGKALQVEIRPEGLWCKFQYAVNENPRAALIWRLVVGGYLRAFSIGAIVWNCIYYWDMDEDMADLPPGVRESLKAGTCWCVITDAELVEISQVFVGANRAALLRAAREGVITRELFKSLVGGTMKQPPPAAKAPETAQQEAPETPAPSSLPATQEADPPAAQASAPATEPTEEPTEDEQFEALLEQRPDLIESLADLLEDLL